MKRCLVLFWLAAAAFPALAYCEFAAAPQAVLEGDALMCSDRIEGSYAAGYYIEVRGRPYADEYVRANAGSSEYRRYGTIASGMREFDALRRVNGPETCI